MKAMTDGQNGQSSILEVVPLGESSYDSNTLTEESEGNKRVKYTTFLHILTKRSITQTITIDHSSLSLY